MSLAPFHPASGIGKFYERSAKIIRFVRYGCANRPFFHIVVMERRKNQHQPPIEQVGTYDPMPNQYNQQLVSLNVERIRHWIGSGAHLSRPVAELLGISGLIPIHPRTYITAWRNRKELAKAKEEAQSAETSPKE
ncbi:probable 28S ribosomal protein S16, mitochondrial [Phlebotomus papatasi]|uniref:probable 28S ribosomal protein S16, mitochondrial n=1 Tax=Phlebotomus papatasi TaxID=29031 RepID=UPI0024833D5E|nr:probable 28S ribosomal protein S16, mitochondrial [Phlebotomus papatasi]